MAISEDEKWLASYDKYSKLVIYNLKSKKKFAQIDTKDLDIDKIAFGKQGASIVAYSDDEVSVIDINSKKIKFTIQESFLDFSAPTFTNGRQKIVIPTAKNSLNLYSASTGALLKNIGAKLSKESFTNYSQTRWTDYHILNYLKYISPMELSPNKRFMALGKIDTSVVIKDLEQGHSYIVFKAHHAPVTAIQFLNDSVLYTGDTDGELIVWNIKNNSILLRKKLHQHVIFDMTIDTLNNILTTTSWDATVRKHNLKTLSYLDYKEQTNAAIYRVNKVKSNLYQLEADMFGEMVLKEEDTEKTFVQFIGHSKLVSDHLFADSNEDTLCSVSWDGSFRMWDVKTGILLAKWKHPKELKLLAVEKHPNLPILFIAAEDHRIYVYHFKHKTIKKVIKVGKHAICHLAVTDKFLLARNIYGAVHWINLETKEPQMVLNQLSAEDWLFSNPDGYFEGTKTAMDKVNYVNGLKTLSVQAFFQKFYTPSLYRSLFSETRNTDGSKNIDSFLKDEIKPSLLYKGLEITNIPAVQDSVVQLKIEWEEKKQNKVSQLMIYNNNKLVRQKKLSSQVSFRGVKEAANVTLPLIYGDNNIKIELVNEDEITIGSVEQIFVKTGNEPKRELFILSVGINEYQNPNYNLTYAANDAIDISKRLKKSAATLFDEVIVFNITDAKAKKENIIKELDAIDRKIGAEDVFIFFYAGHGVMIETDQSKEFLMVLSEVTNLYDNYTSLKNKTISASELFEISKKLRAQKQIFILDACQSGGVLESLALRGVEREKAIAQLAKSSGTYFITASQKTEYANEVGSLEHGIFTYAILELLSGNSSSIQTEEISVFQLKNYVERRVPELSKEYNGSAQYPTGYAFGNDFPIGLVKK